MCNESKSFLRISVAIAVAIVNRIGFMASVQALVISCSTGTSDSHSNDQGVWFQEFVSRHPTLAHRYLTEQIQAPGKGTRDLLDTCP